MKRLADRLTTKKLPCGLNVHVYKLEGVHYFTIDLLVHFGAMYEKFKVDESIVEIKTGLAHFLEHLMFNLEKGDMTLEFDKYRLDNNAYTSLYTTDYYCSGVQNFYEGISLVLKMVFNAYLSDESVEKEKKIIINEALRDIDSPSYPFNYAISDNLYENKLLCHDICGSLDDIKSTTKEDLQEVYDLFYHPKNMDLIIVGDVNVDEIFSFLDQELLKNHFNEYKNPLLYLEKESLNPVKEYDIVECDVSSYQICTIGKISNENYDVYKTSKIIYYVLSEMIGFDTRWIQKLINKRIIARGLSYGITGEPDYPAIYIDSTTDQYDLLVKKLKRRIKSFKWWMLKKKTLERSKKKSIGSSLSKDTVGYYRTKIIDTLIYKVDIDDYIKKVNEITIKDAREYLKVIKNIKFITVIQKPKTKK